MNVQAFSRLLRRVALLQHQLHRRFPELVCVMLPSHGLTPSGHYSVALCGRIPLGGEGQTHHAGQLDTIFKSAALGMSVKDELNYYCHLLCANFLRTKNGKMRTKNVSARQDNKNLK